MVLRNPQLGRQKFCSFYQLAQVPTVYTLALARVVLLDCEFSRTEQFRAKKLFR